MRINRKYPALKFYMLFYIIAGYFVTYADENRFNANIDDSIFSTSLSVVKISSHSKKVENVPESLIHIVTDSDGVVWGKRSGYNLYKSTDKLQTVEFVYKFPEYINCIHVTENGVIIVATDIDRWDNNNECHIFRSLDGGISFEQVLAIEQGSAIWWSIVSDSMNNIYIGEYGLQFVNSAKNVWKSSDNGETWEVIFKAPNIYGVHIHVVDVDPFTDYLWVVHGDHWRNGIYMSKDRGVSWEHIYKGTQPTAIEFTEDAVYFGEDGPEGKVSRYDKSTGDYETVLTVSELGNYGGSAYAMSRGPSGTLYSSFVKYSDEKFKPSIWASRNGIMWELIWEEEFIQDSFQGFITLSKPDKDGGIFGIGIKINDYVVATGVTEADHASNIKLMSYPNPFNLATTISFSIPKGNEWFTLDIYSVTGQNIKRLMSEYYGGGTYNIIWDGTDRNNNICPSSVYIYRLDTGSSVYTNKIMLLK